MLIQENIKIAPLTTMGVGGPARFFVEASTVEEVREAIGYAKSRNLPLFILGGGSNLVVSDAGWPGLVLKAAIVSCTASRIASGGRAGFRDGSGVGL